MVIEYNKLLLLRKKTTLSCYYCQYFFVLARFPSLNKKKLKATGSLFFTGVERFSFFSMAGSKWNQS
jgi:hypothetical protein